MTVREVWLPEYVSETGEVYPAKQVSVLFKERDLDCGCIAGYQFFPHSRVTDPAYLSHLESLLDAGLDREAGAHQCKEDSGERADLK